MATERTPLPNLAATLTNERAQSKPAKAAKPAPSPPRADAPKSSKSSKSSKHAPSSRQAEPANASRIANAPVAPVAKRPASKALVPAKPVAEQNAKDGQKLVRDSFTMPRSDFAQIAMLKERALNFRRPTKKSELIRAGLHALAALDDAQLQKALDSLAVVKKGRPKRED